MDPYKLGEMEQRMADLIWRNAPLRTRELVALCQDAFGWKRTTTYTMLKRLCERGLFENSEGEVFILKTKEEFHAEQGEQFLNETFSGSLPQFVAAFMKSKRLKPKEIEEIARLIDEHKEE